MARPDDLYRTLFERSADASLIIEEDTFIDCNQAAVEMLGYSSRDDLLSSHPSELSPPTQPGGHSSFELANDKMATAIAQGSYRFEWEHRRANGEVFPVEVLLTTIRRGPPALLHVVWRDLSTHKQLERHLRQTQMMEAIGKLAGGIAHDFNNLLVTIGGNAELIALRAQGQPKLLQNVHEIQLASDRAAELVRHLMAFSRGRERSPQTVDINQVLSTVRALLQRLIGTDVQLTIQAYHRPLWAQIDPVQLERVLLNLATNARDAMPSGGSLSITLDQAQLSASGANAHHLSQGCYAMIAVADTGEGMDAHTVSKVFEPFFSTKAPGKGTGLGLFSVYAIAQGAGGSVQVQSSLGAGTTMTLFLPTSCPQATSSTDSQELPTAGGHETILLVEDEVHVSALIAGILRDKGYQLLIARDGEQAWELWLQHPQGIDLLLTDIVMPKLGGAALLQRLLRHGHRPRVLFLSGYTDNALAQLGSIATFDLLAKPFSSAELVGRVRRALDRAPEPPASDAVLG